VRASTWQRAPEAIRRKIGEEEDHPQALLPARHVEQLQIVAGGLQDLERAVVRHLRVRWAGEERRSAPRKGAAQEAVARGGAST
jgi:hypothetical protein